MMDTLLPVGTLVARPGDETDGPFGRSERFGEIAEPDDWSPLQPGPDHVLVKFFLHHTGSDVAWSEQWVPADQLVVREDLVKLHLEIQNTYEDDEYDQTTTCTVLVPKPSPVTTAIWWVSFKLTNQHGFPLFGEPMHGGVDVETPLDADEDAAKAAAEPLYRASKAFTDASAKAATIGHSIRDVTPHMAVKGDEPESDWSWEYIHPFTGVGHAEGDSWYDVKVVGASDPTWVGKTWDFGY